MIKYKDVLSIYFLFNTFIHSNKTGAKLLGSIYYIILKYFEISLCVKTTILCHIYVTLLLVSIHYVAIICKTRMQCRFYNMANHNTKPGPNTRIWFST